MRHTLKHALLAHAKLVRTHGTLVADLATKIDILVQHVESRQMKQKQSVVLESNFTYVRRCVAIRIQTNKGRNVSVTLTLTWREQCSRHIEFTIP